MSLSFAALDGLRKRAALLRDGVALPVTTQCEAAAKALETPEHAGKPPEPADIETLRRALWQICTHDGAENIPFPLLRRAPHAFWNGERWAAAIPGLVRRFLLLAAVRPLWLRDVIEAWLRDFNPALSGFEETGQEIATLVRGNAHPRVKFWAEVDRRHALFTASEGPRRLGLALLAGPGEVAAILAESGMQDALRAESRFFRAAIAALLRSLPPALNSAAAATVWERVAPLLEISHPHIDSRGRPAPARHGLRFPDLMGETVRACLSPWLLGPPAPQAPKKPIESFLIRTIGDPRLEPTRWTQAGEDATRLMRSWLAAATLEAFFRLISKHSDDRQWRYREAFWRACLTKVPDAEVWVVLGRELAGRAEVVRDLNGNFGQMATNEQAVLLIRLKGSLVLSEWSNVGMLRTWDSTDKLCPKLYALKGYEVAALKPGRNGITHHSPERGLWQNRAAQLLWSKLGIRLFYTDYMPQ